MRMQLSSHPKMKARTAGGNLQWPQLAAAGGTLATLDSSGNIVGSVDPTKTTVSWTCPQDPAGFTFTFADPADTTKVTIKSTGKAETGITFVATLTNLDGSPPLPPATSVPIDVPAGVATAVEIVLGNPS